MDAAPEGGPIGGDASASGGSPGAGGSVSTGGVVGSGGAAVAAVATSVAAGFAHTCAVGSNGSLYCWGGNTSSALGGASGPSSVTPQAVASPGDGGGFEQVTAGLHFGCGRHSDGRVFCWGRNDRGPLGLGDTSVRPTPTQVPLAGPAAMIVAPFEVTCALLEDGSLWCWGDNLEGQAAQDDPAPYQNALSPRRIPGPAFTFVSAGQGHVCGLRAPGALWCWGRNLRAELGQGETDPPHVRYPIQVGTEQDYRMVSAGAFQTCAIRSDGSLWCWGENTSGQLAVGDTAPRLTPTRVGTGTGWTTVSLSPFHGCGLRGTGTLWCWGRNDEGQLGLPWDPNPTTAPVRIGTRSDWVEVSSGWMHTCARRADGALFCTGGNDEGRIGDGSTTRPYAFVPVSALP